MSAMKPWQVVILVVAVVAVSVSVYMSFGAAPQIDNMATESRMVDVHTGQVFLFSLGGRKGVIVPETNPDTGKSTLLPIMTDESGMVRITPTALAALRDLGDDLKAVVDRKSGEVKLSDDKPRRVR